MILLYVGDQSVHSKYANASWFQVQKPLRSYYLERKTMTFGSFPK